MQNEWWILPQMNQTIVRARERANTFTSMVENYLPPDCEEAKLAKLFCETANQLFILINRRIIEEDMKNGR